MRLFDLVCRTCGYMFEELLSDPAQTAPCLECGSQAETVVSPVRIALDGTDPGFPRAWEQWAKMREQKMKQEQKKE